MTPGTVGILNVGAGDTKLSFDPSNPIERARAARIVRDMIRRGYVLFVDGGDGKFQRALAFDETKCEYIVADIDPDQAEKSDGQAATYERAPDSFQRRHGIYGNWDANPWVWVVSFNPIVIPNATDAQQSHA